MLYQLVLDLHSWTRWLIILSLLLLFFKSVFSFSPKNRSHYTKTDNFISIITLASAHTQLLLGLLLYFELSPLIKTSFGPGFMADPVRRFWIVEHLSAMIFVIALIHTARILTKKRSNPYAKHKINAIFAFVSLLILALSIPWPWSKIPRPILRGLFHSQVQSIDNVGQND